jgi:hypothetical protein
VAAAIQQGKKKGFRWSALVGAAVVGVVFAIAGAAFADDISNNLDSTVDAVAEAMPLTVGGANGTTRLYVFPTGGDGKPGCNLTGSTTFSISLASSDPSVATVSPSSITFTSCVTSTTGPVVTVTPVAQGTATISASQVSNTTGGTFNLAPVTFSVNVAPPPNTPPQVAVAGVTGGANYDKGSVPAATCEVTDAEDGNSSFPATLSAISGPYASDGVGEQTASCSYTDGGGLTASASETYGIVDPSAPDIQSSVVGTLGNNGWYVSDVSLSWTVTEPQSPNSLQKTGCVDQSITTDQAAMSYSCSATSAGGSAGPVDVSIKRDATKPTIEGSASPAANGAGWNNTDVTVSFTCADNLSGIASCGPDDTLSSEGAGQSATGTAVDDAGNSASATVSSINIDKTPPAINFVSRTPANVNDWNNGNVTVNWSCSDIFGSGVVSASVSKTISDEGANQSATGTCEDVAGNTASNTQSGINIDKTAPAITFVSRTAVNGNGWNNSNVTVNWSCSDGGSSVVSGSVSKTLSDEGANQSATATCEDLAGNEASNTQSGINIDKTAPSVSLVGGPADGASYYFGSVPAAPTCNASDSLSLLDGPCAISGYSAGVGSHTVTASAKDKAGNTASDSRGYTVLAWTLKGFYQPVDMGGVLNIVKNGSTVPLKFEIFAGSTELTDTANVKSLTSAKVNCDGTAPVDEIEATATGGTSLRYDATAGQFVYNWQTPKTAGVCYRVTMTTQDASSLVALFRLK